MKKVYVVTVVEQEDPNDTAVDIYKMTEDELRQYGASKGLSEVQQDILVFRVIEHMRICDIADYRKFCRPTVKYHLDKIKKKLKLDNI